MYLGSRSNVFGFKVKCICVHAKRGVRSNEFRFKVKCIWVQGIWGIKVKCIWVKGQSRE